MPDVLGAVYDFLQAHISPLPEQIVRGWQNRAALPDASEYLEHSPFCTEICRISCRKRKSPAGAGQGKRHEATPKTRASRSPWP